jgi:uncharacterized membrane protein YgcG
MRLHALIVFAFVTFMSTAASADSWKIVRVSGEAWLVTEASKARLRAGGELPAGATVATAPGGRVLLKNNAQTIIVGPSTTMAISAKAGAGLKTTVLQQTGTIEVEVEKRNVRYFSVETPLLAAVVKGTRFTVRVDGQKAEVSVKRGRVEVKDFASGKIGSVSQGQRASTSNRGFTVTGVGKVAAIVQGKPRPATVKPAGAAPASSGQSDDGSTDGNDDGDDGNGNGSGNSGNGNGNGGGDGSNSGGNGNGNSGNGNGNNGNGNGNGGGNGSNSGGNGGGNSGSGNSGNGNGNSGSGNSGNGGGRGHGHGGGNDDDDNDDD